MSDSLELNDVSLALIELAVREDLGEGDCTTRATVPAAKSGSIELVAKSELRFCGHDIAEAVFAKFGDASVSYIREAEEGADVSSGDVIATITGAMRTLLSAERTTLNFLQRTSGIATQSRQLSELVAHTKARILDTRKTAPGFRQLDKYAVKIGGGSNHRIGLYDEFLIKDNHIDAAGGDIRGAISACRDFAPDRPLEIEVRNMEELAAALDENPDMILLDNMSPETMTEAVAIARGHATASEVLLEASGGITASGIRAVAETGVDRISVGALTHSVVAADISALYRA